jgi:hypothetical protein
MLKSNCHQVMIYPITLLDYIGNVLDIKVKKYLKNLVYTRDQYILNSYKLNHWFIIMLLFSLFFNLITLLQNKKAWRAVQITTNNDKLTTTKDIQHTVRIQINFKFIYIQITDQCGPYFRNSIDCFICHLGTQFYLI